VSGYPARDNSLRLAFAPAALPLLRTRLADTILWQTIWARIVMIEATVVAASALAGLLSHDFGAFRFIILMALAGIPLALAPVALYFRARGSAHELAAEIRELERLQQRYGRA
jgi:hypothetical protein